jgi:NTP pyrophosphatase (non-canonical NTP hydrolase)
MRKSEYLLLKLAEECDEVGQRCSKQITFGPDEIQPGHEENNLQRLRYEVNDVLAMVSILGLMPDAITIAAAVERRKVRLEKYWIKSTERGHTDPEPEFDAATLAWMNDDNRG